MTDRIHSITVVLPRNIREDDAESLIKAIGMLRGVVSVTGNVADPIADHVAYRRAKSAMIEGMWNVINAEPKA